MDQIEELIEGLKEVQAVLDEDSPHFETVEAAIVLLSGELPCSVKLPPATTIVAGCSINTLFAALRFPDRPRHFQEQPVRRTW